LLPICSFCCLEVMAAITEPPLQLNNSLMAEQLIEYRARQQQKYEAKHERDEAGEQDASPAEAQVPHEAERRAARPCALTLRADGIASNACPGTPREYRTLQKDRFEAELARRQLDEDVSAFMQAAAGYESLSPTAPRTLAELMDGVEAVASSPPTPSTASSEGSMTSPTTPRMRGSSSLRAISAARAMRTSEAVPLPGAAWPGHAQKPPKPSGPGRSHSAFGRSAAPLPPRAPLKKDLPSLRRSDCRNSAGLPPRPPMPMQRSFSNCALEVASPNDGALIGGAISCC